MHAYRTHTCGELRREHEGDPARLSGWVHRKRDHGNLLFVDLRDHYGLTQCVIDSSSPVFPEVEAIRLEAVITATGRVVRRSADTVNPDLPTGEVELVIESFEAQSHADPLPLEVNSDRDYGEEIRLRYRFLDLRRDKMHRNIMLRSAVIQSIRRRMIEGGFTEFQTPILSAASPEGARDFLVPSRLHPGGFYALPQAPQQFKQLIMAAGFDRYFQIAPCFRDEDARADRSPGEFYQLDFEMSFVTQEDVFAALEPVLFGVFDEFSGGRPVSPAPFPRIPYAEAMLAYGSDKPDLRNPLRIAEATEIWRGTDFKIFARQIETGAVVRAIPAPGAAAQPRSFFDRLNDWARDEGAGGLGYIVFEDGEAKGPIARFLDVSRMDALREATGTGDGDAVFFSCGEEDRAARFAGLARTRIGEELNLVDRDRFLFCWIVDFPDVRARRTDGRDRILAQPVLDAAGRPRSAGDAGPALDPRLPVRHRLQRGGAVERRDQEPPARHHVQGLRDRGLRQGRGRGALRRDAERAAVRRAAAWRVGARHRPDRDAARRRAQHPRDHAVSDEPAGPGPDDGIPGSRHGRPVARAVDSRHSAARERLRPYLIFASLNRTCLRATGSYFRNSSLPVVVRVFFFAM